jgi:D-alanyl-D-alanine carboxypeptidase/D-alanyl-D-alanine-endopeptidase (penicillin-binding protein 4)
MSFLSHLARRSTGLRTVALALLLSTSSLAGLAASAPPERVLPAEVATALARARVPRDAVSMLVLPLDAAGAPRLAHRVDTAMNPASVMKLVTTLAALDTLGSGFTWKTQFYADGPVAGGVLQGNLYVRGGGDPKFVLERIDAAFRELQARGVQQVRGDMVLDSSIFETIARDPGEFDGEPMRPYNATPDGLLVNFKSLILTFVPQPDGLTALVKSEPPMAGVQIDATVPLNRQSCVDWRGDLQPDFSDPNAVHFLGAYSAKCGERVWPLAYVDPASYGKRVLQAMFTGAGGTLTGTVRDGRTPPQARLLMEAPSLPLGEMIADVNKFSNNVMAQQVFLTLGAQARGQGSLASAREAISNWWRKFMGTKTVAPLLDNGSGLSRQERITATALGQMLQRAAAHPEAEVYMRSLSLAGFDGTTTRMRERGIAPHAMGNAWLKTGSLRDVASVAGFANGLSGRRYVVVGIINHPNAPAARPALDAMVEWAVNDREVAQ